MNDELTNDIINYHTHLDNAQARLGEYGAAAYRVSMCCEVAIADIEIAKEKFVAEPSLTICLLADCRKVFQELHLILDQLLLVQAYFDQAGCNE